MRTARLILILSLAVVTAASAVAVGNAPPDVGIDQHLGKQLPLNVPFRDDVDGAEHPLGDWFHTGHPAVVVMGYFGCPQLCTIVMNGLVESLTEITGRVGRDFDVFFISIDPNETPKLGAEKKTTYVLRYGKPETAHGWHFLTGSTTSIKAVADTIGFRYQYQPEHKQYAHGSGLVVATPTGKLSQYFYGIEFPPEKMNAAIKTAQGEKQGHSVEELLLLCCNYNPISGPHGLVIWRSLQGGALLTLTGLGWFVVRSVRHDQKLRKAEEVST